VVVGLAVAVRGGADTGADVVPSVSWATTAHDRRKFKSKRFSDVIVERSQNRNNQIG